jgi:flagellar biosynthesis protein FlhG
LDEQDRSRLVQLAGDLGGAASVVLFDCAAGIGRNVCAFTRSVDDLIIVTTPEPTALVDAYALVVAVADAPVVPRLHLVVNMAQDKEELAEVQERFLRTCDLFQGVTLEVHPGVPLDPVVRNAVRQRLPFMLLDPHSAPSKAVDRIAGRLLGLDKPTKRRWWSRLWS